MKKLPAGLLILLISALSWALFSCSGFDPGDPAEIGTGDPIADIEEAIGSDPAGNGSEPGIAGVKSGITAGGTITPADNPGRQGGATGGKTETATDRPGEQEDFAMAVDAGEQSVPIEGAGAPASGRVDGATGGNRQTKEEQPPEPGTLGYIIWKREQENKPEIDSWVFNEDDESGRWWDIDTGPRGFEHFVFID